MKINKNLINQFKNSKSKLLAVTKYWNLEEIKEFISEVPIEDLDILVWFWENRVNSLKEKKLDREQVHFIWNVQTKEIKYIIKYCDTIHSIDNEKHIKKIEDICKKSDTWMKIFLQINVDKAKPGWINISDIPKFIELIDNCENVSLVWFSAIWKASFIKEDKVIEFQILKELRDKYIPNWLISAWTSRDYKIALDEEIDIIRVWKALII